MEYNAWRKKYFKGVGGVDTCNNGKNIKINFRKILFEK